MTASNEEWRPIERHPGYEVSNLGRVRSLDRVVIRSNGRPAPQRGKVVSPILFAKGYYRVKLTGGQRHAVHQLVCAAFHGQRPSPAHETAHWDDNKLNNHEGNLRWATPADNGADKVRNGRTVNGERHWDARLTADQVVAMRSAFDSGSCTNMAELARRFGITPPAAKKICLRKTWKHIDGGDPEFVGSTTGEQNGQARLTPDDVRHIRLLSAEGKSRSTIAEQFGVDPVHVWNICNGKRWKHIA